MTLDDIKNFRQLDSANVAGHPEYRWTSGVETTTGPLGQGLATSVGMAIARQVACRSATTNRASNSSTTIRLRDQWRRLHDGRRRPSEAASLAGHLKLSNLCWIYDNNKITIEGNTAWSFSEDVATRFIAYGWNVVRVGDANDLEMLDPGVQRRFKKTS